MLNVHCSGMTDFNNELVEVVIKDSLAVMKKENPSWFPEGVNLEDFECSILGIMEQYLIATFSGPLTALGEYHNTARMFTAEEIQDLLSMNDEVERFWNSFSFEEELPEHLTLEMFPDMANGERPTWSDVRLIIEAAITQAVDTVISAFPDLNEKLTNVLNGVLSELIDVSNSRPEIMGMARKSFGETWERLSGKYPVPLLMFTKEDFEEISDEVTVGSDEWDDLTYPIDDTDGCVLYENFAVTIDEANRLFTEGESVRWATYTEETKNELLL